MEASNTGLAQGITSCRSGSTVRGLGIGKRTLQETLFHAVAAWRHGASMKRDMGWTRRRGNRAGTAGTGAAGCPGGFQLCRDVRGDGRLQSRHR